MAKSNVGSVMRSPPIIASLSESVLAIAEKMITNNIGAIIIVSNDKPVGVVTERDIVESVLRWSKDPGKEPAQVVMSSPLISVEADKSIQDALDLMREKKIRRLAVTKKGKLVGIVTERRLLNSLS